ncbi:MAG: hypothetical protein ACI4AB_10310 [Acetatifactor sp.]
MKRKAGSFGFVAATIILVLVAALFFAGTVMSRTDLDAAELEGYYREKEEQLVKDTREYLNRRGFSNSGVMLTRVVEEDGRRQYTVTVHHGEIDRMTQEKRDELAAELSELDFSDGDCIFFHEFLMYD